MAEVTKSPETPEEIRKKAILDWHDAKTDSDRSALVKKYPVLKSIFSDAQNY